MTSAGGLGNQALSATVPAQYVLKPAHDPGSGPFVDVTCEAMSPPVARLKKHARRAKPLSLADHDPDPVVSSHADKAQEPIRADERVAMYRKPIDDQLTQD